MTHATPAARGADRRSVCRYPVLQAQAWLGWWEGQKFRSTVAHLVDISLHGCKLTVDQLPPPDQAVWFCPPGTAPSDWIEAKLIEAKRRLFGPRVVRIAFHSTFPYETFKDLVYGHDAAGGLVPGHRYVPEPERDYW